MGYRAIIQSELGEQLRLVYPDGSSGGKAILTFIRVAEAHCSKQGKPDEEAWFLELEKQQEGSLCEVLHPIINWDMENDSLDSSLNVVLKTKWVDANLLWNSTNELITLLQRSKPPSTWWYVPEDTLLDFLVLSQTLLFMMGRYAGKARIFFR